MDRAIVSHRGVRSIPSTYAAQAGLAGRFAAAFRALGIQPGERIVLWGENSAAWVAAFFGCVLCGIVVVPLDATGSVGFADRVVKEVTPRLILGDAGLLRQLHTSLPTLALASAMETLPAEPDLRVERALHVDSILQIVFTSGTTSEPKGVVHTHRNVLASVEPIEREIAQYRRYERIVHPLRFLHTLPLSHVFGQFMGLWLPPLLSAEVHFPEALEPNRLLAIIRRERVSVLVAVPRMLELLRVSLQQRFPNLKAELAASGGWPAWKRWWRFRAVHRELGWKFWALICGGATLSAELEEFWHRLGLPVIQGYGMTETAALVTLNHPFRTGKGTLGKTLPGRELRISSEGEIQVRGDVLAAGSWQDGHFQPREGEWLSTGDLGTRDAAGDVRFTGRKSDVIVTAAGLNLHPQDLEAALLAQPGVRACAVVACQLRSGTEPVGVVVSDENAADLREITARANGGLAVFQRLRYVLRWPGAHLPYTASGKLLRRTIARWAEAELSAADLGNAESAGSVRAGSVGAGEPLLALIGAITHETVPELADSARLTEDLHLDSLGRVQLQSAMASQLGAEIGDDEFALIATLGELRARLSAPGALGPARIGFEGLDSGPEVVQDKRRLAPARPLRYPRWPWSWPVQWLRVAFLEGVVRPLVWFLARPRTKIGEPGTLRGPLLLVANHVNIFDLPLILYALPGRLRRHLAVAMSAEVLTELRQGRRQRNVVQNLFARPAAFLLVALFNLFPLPRLLGFWRSFAHAGEALDRGYSVLVFPEGRRGYTGELQPFRPGIGLLTAAAGVPVLPVALRGAGSTARQGGKWFRPPHLAVWVGTPMRFAEGTSPEDITKALQHAVAALGPS